jgi:hypothetical protein
LFAVVCLILFCTLALPFFVHSRWSRGAGRFVKSLDAVQQGRRPPTNHVFFTLHNATKNNVCVCLYEYLANGPAESLARSPAPPPEISQVKSLGSMQQNKKIPSHFCSEGRKRVKDQLKYIL